MLFALRRRWLVFTNTGFAKNCATEYCFGYKYVHTWTDGSKDNTKVVR